MASTYIGLALPSSRMGPAGIEPATPSLPSMRGRFTLPCSTLRVHTSAQVSGTVEVVT
jgi:hypothetical protein